MFSMGCIQCATTMGICIWESCSAKQRQKSTTMVHCKATLYEMSITICLFECCIVSIHCMNTLARYFNDATLLSYPELPQCLGTQIERTCPGGTLVGCAFFSNVQHILLHLTVLSNAKVVQIHWYSRGMYHGHIYWKTRPIISAG